MKDPIYKERKTNLIAEITAAFDGVAREDGVTLHEATAIDDYGSGNEKARAAARKRDTESRWQDVPSEHIAQTDAVLNFLDGKGLRYYLPAYLVWYLKSLPCPWDDNNENAVDSNTFHSVDFHLAGGTGDEVEEYYRLRFEFFNYRQSRAVAHFLEFVAWHEHLHEEEYRKDFEARHHQSFDQDWSQDTRRTLERYWGKFL